MATQIRLADGGYLETYSGSDGRLHVQKYTAGGTPVGADHALPYESPQFAALSDGGFVVTRSFYAYGWNMDVYVFSPASVQQASFGTAGGKLLASPEGGFALAGTRTDYRGDGDGPETFVTLYSNAGVKVFQEGPFLGDSSGLTLLESGDYRYAGVTIDPSNPLDAASPTAPSITIIDDVAPQGVLVNDSTPTMRVAVAEEGRLQYSGSYHEDPYSSVVVTAADVARGYVDVPVKGYDGTHNYRVRMIDNEGLTSGYTAVSYTVDTTAPGAAAIARVMDNQGPVEGQVPAGGATDDLSPTLHLTTPGAKAGDQVQLYQDGQVFGAPVALTVGDVDRGYVAITPTLASGAYSFSARVTDQAGNVGPMGGAFSFNVQSEQQQTTLAISGGGAKAEGDAGSTAFTFTVTRSGDLSLSTAVDYFLLGDPTDFTGQTSSTLSFAPGEQTKAIQILVQGDTAVEADESFEVGLSNARGAVIGAQKATGVIQNDDGTQPPADAQPSITPAGLSVNENGLPSGTARDTDVIKLTAADGVDDFTVEGRAVITDGVFSPMSFTTPLGATLSFTAYDAATTTLSVSYSLSAGVDHTGGETSLPNVREKVDRLSLELTDNDGDTVRSLLNATVYDDGPIAQNDSDVAVVGGPAATGNVITDAAAGDAGDNDNGADRAGPDTPLRVSAVRNGPVEDTTPDMLDDFVSTGRFGTLTINANGNYSYVLHSNPEDGVTDSFGYTVRDADGSVSGASLSIQVQGGQNARGQVLVADQPGDTLAGGSGPDTLMASRGPDQLTGGGGADHFTFEALPWRAGVVTDFADGSDKIDLTALYQASGYTGTNAVADNYVRFESDGAGGTRVMYDTDGAGSAQAWAYHITTLQGVAASALSNADLVGGSSQPPPQQPTIGFRQGATNYAMEGNQPGGVGSISFTVDLSAPATQAVSATWTVSAAASNSASESDFGGSFPTGTLGIAQGATSATFSVAAFSDTTYEPDEAFVVTLSNIVGAQAGVVTRTGIIANDDPAPTTGQVITSPGPGSTVTGGAGGDTLYASQGPDVLTGAGGGDAFVFRALPWNAGRITDFAVGSDRLDLSAIFQASGYTGSDPVADQRISLQSDGSGGTRVYFDRDAPAAGDWPFLVTTLQGVSPGGVTWAQLSGGAAPAGPPQVSFQNSYIEQAEGNSGVTLFRYPVVRTGDVSGMTSVHWTGYGHGPNPAVTSDFAQGYMPVGAITFSPGETLKYIDIQVIGDTQVEANEGFQLLLDDIHNGTLGASRSALGIIRNDETSAPAEGQYIRARYNGDVLVGGAGTDTLEASRGADRLTGGEGADLFVFPAAPWHAGVITDFKPGADKIDVSALLDAYTGSNPVADGWLRLDNINGSTKVYVDLDGPGGEWPIAITTLQGVAPGSVALSDFVL